MKITVRYQSIDRCYKRRTFATLEGARKFAQMMIGEAPEIGGSYAVSGDGIGKITANVNLYDLFPKCRIADTPSRDELSLAEWEKREMDLLIGPTEE